MKAYFSAFGRTTTHQIRTHCHTPNPGPPVLGHVSVLWFIRKSDFFFFFFLQRRSPKSRIHQPVGNWGYYLESLKDFFFKAGMPGSKGTTDKAAWDISLCSLSGIGGAAVFFILRVKNWRDQKLRGVRVTSVTLLLMQVMLVNPSGEGGFIITRPGPSARM